jgi:hypothetical protein
MSSNPFIFCCTLYTVNAVVYLRHLTLYLNISTLVFTMFHRNALR